MDRKKLAETMRFQQFSLSHTNEQIFWMDKDGRFVDANQAVSTKLGYSKAEIMQLTVADIDPYFPFDKWAEFWQQVKQEKTVRFQATEKARDGRIFPIEIITNYFEYNGIGYLCAFVRDITEHLNLLKELENQACKDFLTDLPNRRHFFTLAEQELSHSHRYDKPLSILMMDIDFFKSINDNYGHKTGDLVLKKLAHVCLIILREVDVIGRIGGEEFAILLPETSRIYAIEAAERIRQALENANIVMDQHNVLLQFTVSIGVTTTNNLETTVDKLLQDADTALYQAKKSGRNKVVAFVDDMSSHTNLVL